MFNFDSHKGHNALSKSEKIGRMSSRFAAMKTCLNNLKLSVDQIPKGLVRRYIIKLCTFLPVPWEFDLNLVMVTNFLMSQLLIMAAIVEIYPIH